MSAFYIILLVLGWLVMGLASFIFWWTRDFDFTTKEIPMALIFSTVGPFDFFIGYLIHRPRCRRSRVIFRARIASAKPVPFSHESN